MSRTDVPSDDGVRRVVTARTEGHVRTRINPSVSVGRATTSATTGSIESNDNLARYGEGQ